VNVDLISVSCTYTPLDTSLRLAFEIANEPAVLTSSSSIDLPSGEGLAPNVDYVTDVVLSGTAPHSVINLAAQRRELNQLRILEPKYALLQQSQIVAGSFEDLDQKSIRLAPGPLAISLDRGGRLLLSWNRAPWRGFLPEGPTAIRYRFAGDKPRYAVVDSERIGGATGLQTITLRIPKGAARVPVSLRVLGVSLASHEQLTLALPSPCVESTNALPTPPPPAPPPPAG